MPRKHKLQQTLRKQSIKKYAAGSFRTSTWRTRNPIAGSSLTLWDNTWRDWLKALIAISLTKGVPGKRISRPVAPSQRTLHPRKTKSRWNFLWCHPDIQIKCHVTAWALDVMKKEQSNFSYKPMKLLVTFSTNRFCWRGFSAVPVNKTINIELMEQNIVVEIIKRLRKIYENSENDLTTFKISRNLFDPIDPIELIPLNSFL